MTKPRSFFPEFLRRRSEDDEPFECPQPIICQFPRCNCGIDLEDCDGDLAEIEGIVKTQTQGSEHMSSLRIHESTLADQLADHGLKPGDDYTLDALQMDLLRNALDHYADYLRSLKCEAAGARCLAMLEIINSGFETVVRDVGS